MSKTPPAEDFNRCAAAAGSLQMCPQRHRPQRPTHNGLGMLVAELRIQLASLGAAAAGDKVLSAYVWRRRQEHQTPSRWSQQSAPSRPRRRNKRCGKTPPSSGSGRSPGPTSTSRRQQMPGLIVILRELRVVATSPRVVSLGAVAGACEQEIVPHKIPRWHTFRTTQPLRPRVYSPRPPALQWPSHTAAGRC